MESLFSVRDKVIIITGATGVLGRAMANALAAAGAYVCILARSESKTAALVDRLKSYRQAAFGLIADVTDKESLAAARQHVKDKFEKLDILINAAGGTCQGLPSDQIKIYLIWTPIFYLKVESTYRVMPVLAN